MTPKTHRMQTGLLIRPDKTFWGNWQGLWAATLSTEEFLMSPSIPVAYHIHHTLPGREKDLLPLLNLCRVFLFLDLELHKSKWSKNAQNANWVVDKLWTKIWGNWQGLWTSAPCFKNTFFFLPCAHLPTNRYNPSFSLKEQFVLGFPFLSLEVFKSKSLKTA